MSMSSSLVATGVGVEVRGQWLVRDVTMTVAPGEVVALVGPNGAGKSTLLAALGGDIVPATGEVRLAGRLVRDYRPGELALRRAVLPQQTILQFAFTAREVVAMGRGPRRTGDHHRDEAVVTQSLHRTDTLHVGERVYPTLSGGEQARVTLARVLAQETPLLLLDEPTASLDLRHQQMVMAIARQLAADGAMIVAILHDLNLAAGFAERVAVLHEGRLVADGSPWETLTEPLLGEVFDCPITVTTHPGRGCPLIIF